MEPASNNTDIRDSLASSYEKTDIHQEVVKKEPLACNGDEKNSPAAHYEENGHDHDPETGGTLDGNEEPSNFGDIGEQKIIPDLGPEKEGALDG